MLRNEFFGLIIATMAISQTIKYLVKLYTIRTFTLGHLRQTYLYSSGLPSSHTAVLTSSFLYLYHVLGPNNPVLFVFLVLGFLWIYEIHMQRKRFRVQVELLDSLSIKGLSHEEVKLYKDLSGHDAIDIVLGFFVGIGVFWIFDFLHII